MPETPYPVEGTVTNIDGNPARGAVVKIFNLMNGDTIQVNTNSSGQYIVDLANMSRAYTVGDVILIRAYIPGPEYKQAESKTTISGSSKTQNLTLSTELPKHNKDIDDSKLNNVEHHPVANAKKVILVDTTGAVIKATAIEENRSGADCSGSEPDTGRILTLQNVNETGPPVSVWVDDQIIAQADITVDHNGSSSTVTFDNIAIYDSMSIRVIYHV